MARVACANGSMAEFLEGVFQKQSPALPCDYISEVDASSGITFYNYVKLGIKLVATPVIIPSGSPLDQSYVWLYAYTTEEGLQSVLFLGQMPPMLPTTRKEPAEFLSSESIADNFGTRELWGNFCLAFRVPENLVIQIDAPGRDLWLARFDQDLVSQVITAARTGHGDRVAKFLQAGAPGDFLDEEFISGLMIAALGGSSKAVTALVHHGADTEYQEPSSSKTALMLAAENGKVEAAGSLMNAKADPEKVDVSGNTALMLAAIANQPETAGYLALKAERSTTNKHPGEYQGLTAIQIAQLLGHEDVVEALGG